MEKVGNITLDVMLLSNCTHFVFHVIVRLCTASSLRREIRVCLIEDKDRSKTMKHVVSSTQINVCNMYVG